MTSRTGKPLRPHRHAAPYLVPGAPPGTLTPIAGSAKPVISILTINRDVTRPPETANDLSDLPHVDPDGHDMLWIRVTGFGDISPIKTVGETYGIPSLALEDAMSPGWRAEMTDEGDWLFFVLPVPPADFITEKSEHLSLFFRRNLVITFEESPTLLIDRFWQQLIGHKPDEKITHQAGYYAYRVIDTIIDRFFPLLDTEYNTLADLEDALDTDGNPGKKELRQLHRTKRDILYLKRVLFPYKELGTALRQRSQIEKSVRTETLSERSCRTHRPGRRIRQFLPRNRRFPLRHLPEHHVEQNERHHPYTDHHLHHPDAADLHRRTVRHESSTFPTLHGTCPNCIIPTDIPSPCC